MEQIDLSTHGKEIQKAYEQVVRGEADFTWVIYGPDSSKAYKVAESGSDFDEFLQGFDESQIQFGLARVNPPGSDVFKNLLIGWCPDSAPLKPRSSFAQNFAEVSRLLKGYHVQVTARDSDDLDRDELLSRLSAAAGARYSIQGSRSNASSSAATPRPTPKPVAPKPAAVSAPKSTPGPVPVKREEPKIIKPKVQATASVDDDEWNEPEVKERDFNKDPLKPNTSSWKPIGRVNLEEVIREEKARPDPRLEVEQLKQKDKVKREQEIDDYLKAKSAPFGSKAPAPSNSLNEAHQSGGISKDFGSDNGKTPAQLWAERKQKSSGSVKSTPKSSEPKEAEIEEEEEGDVSDLKSRFEKLNRQAEREEADAKVLPSPGARNAFPSSNNLPTRSYDFKSQPAPSFDNGIPSPGAKNAFLAKEDESDKEEDPQAEEEEDEAPQPTLPSRSQAPPPAPPSRNETPTLPSRTQAEPEPEREAEEEEEEEPEPEAAPAEEESGPSAIAEYDYEAAEDNELAFAEGQEIINIQFIDEDWWLGELASGERGLFPANYVTLKE